jgi:hypothetical protein
MVSAVVVGWVQKHDASESTSKSKISHFDMTLRAVQKQSSCLCQSEDEQEATYRNDTTRSACGTVE